MGKRVTFIGITLSMEATITLLDIYEGKHPVMLEEFVGIKNYLDLIAFRYRLKARVRALQTLIREDMISPSFAIEKKGNGWIENYIENMKCLYCKKVFRGTYMDLGYKKFCDENCKALQAASEAPPAPFLP